MLMHENNIKRTSDGILVKAMDISFGATIVMNYKGISQIQPIYSSSKWNVRFNDKCSLNLEKLWYMAKRAKLFIIGLIIPSNGELYGDGAFIYC